MNNKLEQYLQEIIASIALGEQREKDLIEDFNLIRKYLLEIMISDNPGCKDILMESSTADIKSSMKNNIFNVFIVFDLSKFLKIQTCFDRKRPGYLTLEQRRNQSHSMQNKEKLIANLFVDSCGFVSRTKVTNLVHDSIENGLVKYGCYIRGHKDDIYALELGESAKENGLLLNAASENEKLSIEFKILLVEEMKSRKVEPMPRNSGKTHWFAALDFIETPDGPRSAWRDRAFSLSTPHIDLRIAQNIALCMAHRLVQHLLPANYVKELFLRSALYEEALYQQIQTDDKPTKLLLLNVLLMILMRLERYFRKNRFPFYFNTNVNLLMNVNQLAIKSICSKLQSILKELESMRTDENLEYESVLNFFDVRVDVDLIKIDCFGAFRSF